MGTLRVMSKEKLADTETPVSAYLKLCWGKPDSFLLESVETKDVTGRYSVVALDPVFALELHEDETVCQDAHRVLIRWAVEGSLNLSTLIVTKAAMEDHDPAMAIFCVGKCAPQLTLDVALCVRGLGETASPGFVCVRLVGHN